MQLTTDNETETISSRQREFQEILETDLQCNICQDIFINPLVLNCAHSFCKFCVFRWLASHKACPTCRMPVSFQAENLVIRNIVNKLISKSSKSFQTARRAIVEQRLNDELTLPNKGLMQVIKDSQRGNARHPPINLIVEGMMSSMSDSEYEIIEHVSGDDRSTEEVEIDEDDDLDNEPASENERASDHSYDPAASDDPDASTDNYDNESSTDASIDNSHDHDASTEEHDASSDNTYDPRLFSDDNEAMSFEINSDNPDATSDDNSTDPDWWMPQRNRGRYVIDEAEEGSESSSAEDSEPARIYGSEQELETSMEEGDYESDIPPETDSDESEIHVMQSRRYPASRFLRLSSSESELSDC